MNIAQSWEEISLKRYEELMSFINAEEKMSDLDRSIEMCAILSGDRDNAREQLLNMSMEDLIKELNKIHFVVEKYKSKPPKTEYIIDGKEYTVQLNIKGMTAAQYIDFQNFYKDYEKNFKYIFLCFLIPKGKKYNDGYDVMELADELYDKISITIVTDIMVFFCRLLKGLTEATLISSVREMKKLLKKEKDPLKKYQLRKAIVQTRKALSLVRSEIELVE